MWIRIMSGRWPGDVRWLSAVLVVVAISVAAGSSTLAIAASGYASCELTSLRATAGLQGATGSMLGGVTLRNPCPTCTLIGRPVVELDWHGRQVTPPQQRFPRGSLKSMGPFRLNRTLVHGKSLFVWLQWWNYCGPKPWGTGSFRPVAILRVDGESGSVRATFRDAVLPPYCNSPKYARFGVSDFGTTP
jgi:hypothetical protein